MHRLLSVESRILLVHNCAVEPTRSHHCGDEQGRTGTLEVGFISPAGEIPHLVKVKLIQSH